MNECYILTLNPMNCIAYDAGMHNKSRSCQALPQSGSFCAFMPVCVCHASRKPTMELRPESGMSYLSLVSARCIYTLCAVLQSVVLSSGLRNVAGLWPRLYCVMYAAMLHVVCCCTLMTAVLHSAVLGMVLNAVLCHVCAEPLLCCAVLCQPKLPSSHGSYVVIFFDCVDFFLACLRSSSLQLLLRLPLTCHMRNTLLLYYT